MTVNELKIRGNGTKEQRGEDRKRLGRSETIKRK